MWMKVLFIYDGWGHYVEWGMQSMCNVTWGDQGSQIEIELKLIWKIKWVESYKNEYVDMYKHSYKCLNDHATKMAVTCKKNLTIMKHKNLV
jgi:hypothetical protein